MDEVCRLCCSTEFVSNNIFDEDTGLYLKMSLYLPIKVIKNDRLPQQICDPCNCKVDDFYQFCTQAIEAQNRLQLSLVPANEDNIPQGSADPTVIKENVHSPPHAPPQSPPHSPTYCPPHQITVEPVTYNHQTTQTDFDDFKPAPDRAMAIKVKSEPQDAAIQWHPTPSPVIMEYTDLPTYHNSDSDDTLLIKLQEKKTKRKTKLKKVKFNDQQPNKRVKKEGNKKQVKNHLNKRIKKEVDTIEKEPEGPIVFSNDTPLELRLQMMADEDFIEDSVDKKRKRGKEKRDYFCCVCLKEYKSKKLMLLHYDKHVNEHVKPAEFSEPLMPEERPLKCNRCYAVMEESEWTAHWARHWEKDHRPLRCALCPSSMQSAKGALEHSQKHSSADFAAATAPDSDSVPHFGCDLCQLSYKTKRELMTHRTLAHPAALGGPLLLRCSVCERTFNRASSHYRHMQVHRTVREHLCNICGKALSSREHLKSHIKIHTGCKPHECKTCGKAFKEKYHLTVHERSHTGTKPYVCPTCGRGFSQKSPLVIHIRSHTGERPYVCKLCGRGFVSQGLLTMHHKSTCI